MVFSGFNQRAVIAFLRTLKANNIDYAIIAKSQEDDIFLTDYKEKVLAIRSSLSLNLEDLLSSIKMVKEQTQAEEYIIAPTTEALNRFLLEKRELFEKNGCVIPLVKKELYEQISDKYSFGKICSKNNILIPKEFKFSKNMILPVVAKPKKYFSSTKREILSPIIIKHSIDFELFCENYNIEDFYYQEYVNGKSLYLLYYFHRNGMIYKLSQENLIQQPDGKSMVAAISSDFHNSSESQKYESLFKNINFFGLVMVEVKQQNNKNYMIEANPRFWGPSQLFVDAEMNFFEAFLHDFGLLKQINISEESFHSTKYFWFGGMQKYLDAFEKLVFYNYDLNLLFNEFWIFLRNDIYLREDTSNIFTKEVLNLQGEINLEIANQKNSINKTDKLIVSVGAGCTQLPFIKALKERGYSVAAFGKGRNDLNAIKLCDYFKEIDTSNHEEAIKWLQGLPIEVSAAGSFAGGVAIKTLHEVSRTFNLPTSIPKLLSVDMNKFEQQKLYEKYQLTSIKTFSSDELRNNQTLVKGINKFIIKPSIGRGSAGVRKINLIELYQMIENNNLSEKDIIQELKEGEEYRMLIIVQNSELKLLAPIKRQSFHESFLLGRLSHKDDKIIQIKNYVNRMIKNLRLKDVIIKADIIVSEENVDMIEMDIGVGGGIYYKTYISYLFDYDIQEEYINLITGKEVIKSQAKGKKMVMDYVYNLSGRPVTYDNDICKEMLNNFLGKNIILIPNLLHPEKRGSFGSNADFIFCLIHENDMMNNLEVNRYVNKELFIKVKG